MREPSLSPSQPCRIDEDEYALPSYEELSASISRYQKDRSDKKISKLIHYYGNQNLRIQTINFFTKGKYNNNELIPVYGTYYKILYNYDRLSECHCSFPFKRSSEPNARQALADIILDAISLQEGDAPIHIAAIGSGFLLNELFLLALFVKNKLYNLKFDFIDIENQDKTQHDFAYLEDVAETQKEIVKQFLTLLHYGMGLQIQCTVQSVDDPCKVMNNETKIFEQKAETESYIPLDHKIQIGFFGSTQEYADYLTDHDHGMPSILYDIDLESESKKSDSKTLTGIQAPVKQILPTGTLWFSAHKEQDWLNNAQPSIDIDEAEKITDEDWAKTPLTSFCFDEEERCWYEIPLARYW